MKTVVSEPALALSPFFSHVPWKFNFCLGIPGWREIQIPQPACHVRSSVSKTFSKFVPPIRSIPALPIMFTNALSRRKAAVACVAVSMSSIRALGQSTSQIFGPSRRRVATPFQSPPSARARGAGAFGGVVGRRARSSGFADSESPGTSSIFFPTVRARGGECIRVLSFRPSRAERFSMDASPLIRSRRGEI